MLFIFAVLFGLQTQTAEIKTIKEDNGGLQLSEYILHSDSSNDRVTFVPGDSQYDIEQKRQVEDEQRKVLAAKSYTTYQNRQTSYEGNPYPYGWCTWYAAQKKNISTSFGDARYWPVNSKEPQAGAVVVTYESPRGHVAYVEAVEGDKVVVSEMNYIGWGKTNTRVIDKNSRFIKGYLI